MFPKIAMRSQLCRERLAYSKLNGFETMLEDLGAVVFRRCLLEIRNAVTIL